MPHPICLLLLPTWIALGIILYHTHDQIVSNNRLIDALKNHAKQLESICHLIVSLAKKSGWKTIGTHLSIS